MDPSIFNACHKSAKSCPHCGTIQRSVTRGKDKVIAGVLALFLGSLGVHRFYLGQWRGISYLLFCWTFIPALIAFIEGIVFLCSKDEVWYMKYG